MGLGFRVSWAVYSLVRGYWAQATGSSRDPGVILLEVSKSSSYISPKPRS